MTTIFISRSTCKNQKLSISGMLTLAMTRSNWSPLSLIIDRAIDPSPVAVTEDQKKNVMHKKVHRKGKTKT